MNLGGFYGWMWCTYEFNALINEMYGQKRCKDKCGAIEQKNDIEGHCLKGVE